MFRGGGNLLTLNKYQILIEFVIPNMSQIIFVYKIFFSIASFEIFFLIQNLNNLLNLWVCVINSQKLSFSQKKTIYLNCLEYKKRVYKIYHLLYVVCRYLKNLNNGWTLNYS